MWLRGGNSGYFAWDYRLKMTGIPVLSLRGRNYKIWLSSKFFSIQLFPNWTACSLIAYTPIKYTHKASEGSDIRCSLLSVTFPWQFFSLQFLLFQFSQRGSFSSLHSRQLCAALSVELMPSAEWFQAWLPWSPKIQSGYTCIVTW